MPKNNIGDFFVSIASVIDKASFEASNRLIDGLGNSFNKLIGSARNAANTLANTALDTSKMGDAAYKMSEAWGVSTEAINLWRATAKIATSDAKSLDSALGKLADVKNGLKFGDGFNSFAEGLAKLGMGYDELDNLDVDKQLEKIINHALTTSTLNKGETAKLLQNLLGDGASQLYIKLSDKGVTNIGAYQQSEVQPRIFTGNQDFLNLAGFQEQVNIFDQSIDSLKTLFGSTLAKNLTDPLSNLNDWMVAHGDEIKDAMTNLASALEKIVGKATPYAAGVADLALGLANGDKEKVTEATDNLGMQLAADLGGLITGQSSEDIKKNFKDRTEFINELARYKTEKGYNGNKKIPYEELSPNLQNGINQFGGKKEWKGWIKDGIIRPDGTVTQVAPDDWVFAARNIGDMARAFIPQNYNSVSAPSEYSIVQNFTINGGNDMPQVLRQQAYKGTQEGLLELMEKSSHRLQLMSGTR
jgi:hypothetical protein